MGGARGALALSSQRHPQRPATRSNDIGGTISKNHHHYHRLGRRFKSSPSLLQLATKDGGKPPLPPITSSTTIPPRYPTSLHTTPPSKTAPPPTTDGTSPLAYTLKISQLEARLAVAEQSLQFVFQENERLYEEMDQLKEQNEVLAAELVAERQRRHALMDEMMYMKNLVMMSAQDEEVGDGEANRRGEVIIDGMPEEEGSSPYPSCTVQGQEEQEEDNCFSPYFGYFVEM